MAESYFVRNSGRDPATKALRVRAPTNRVSHQILPGTRVPARQGLKISDAQLRAHWDRLKTLWQNGKIVVHVGGPAGPQFLFDEDKPLLPVAGPQIQPQPVAEPEPVPVSPEPSTPSEPEPEPVSETPTVDVFDMLDLADEPKSAEPAAPEVSLESEETLLMLKKPDLVARASEITGRAGSDLQKLRKDELVALIRGGR
jgi:hypothetical protein